MTGAGREAGLALIGLVGMLDDQPHAALCAGPILAKWPTLLVTLEKTHKASSSTMEAQDGEKVLHHMSLFLQIALGLLEESTLTMLAQGNDWAE